MKKTKGLLVLMMAVLLLVTGCGGGGGGTTPPDPGVTYYDFTSGDSITETDLGEITPITAPTLKSNVEEIDSEFNDNLSSFAPITGLEGFTITVDTGEVFSKDSGDIIVIPEEVLESNPDYYPLQKVTSITSNGNSYTINTVKAALDEVIEDGEFAFTQEVTTSDLDALGAQFAPGVNVRRSPVVGSEKINIDLGTTLYENQTETSNVKLEALGNTALMLKYGYHMRFSSASGLDYFRVALTASQESQIGFRLTGSYTKTIEKDLGNLVNTKLKFTIPAAIPIPVWIDLKIPFIIQAQATATGTCETTLTRKDSGQVGLLYANNGWSYINTYNKSSEFNPFSAQAGAKFSFLGGPKLTSKLYSAVDGPWVTFFGGLTFDAKSANSPAGYEYELALAVEAKAGADIKLFGKSVANLGETTLIDSGTTGKYSLGYGPKLGSMSVSSDSFQMLTDASYALNQFTFKGNFFGEDFDIPLTDTNLVFACTGGTITGDGDSKVYNAPSTPGEYKITVSYTYTNSYDPSTVYSADEEITVTVREPKVLDAIDISPTSISLVKGATYDLRNVTVTANYNDNTSAVVTNVAYSMSNAGGSISGYTYTAPDSVASPSIEFSYTEGGVTETSYLSISVTEPASGGDSGDGGVSGGSVVSLSNDVSSSNVSGSAGTYYDFKITVPAGQTFLVIGTSDGTSATGSIKTYINRGAVATSASNLYADSTGSEVGSGNGFINPAAGDWYIRIVGVTDFTNFFARAAYYNIPSYKLTNNVDPGGSAIVSTTINSSDAAILEYELTDEELSILDTGNGVFSIVVDNVDSDYVVWSVDPKGDPNDPSWIASSDYGTNSAMIQFTSRAQLSNRDKVIIYVDDDGYIGGAVTANGQTHDLSN